MEAATDLLRFLTGEARGWVIILSGLAVLLLVSYRNRGRHPSRRAQEPSISGKYFFISVFTLILVTSMIAMTETGSLDASEDAYWSQLDYAYPPER